MKEALQMDGGFVAGLDRPCGHSKDAFGDSCCPFRTAPKRSFMSAGSSVLSLFAGESKFIFSIFDGEGNSVPSTAVGERKLRVLQRAGDGNSVPSDLEGQSNRSSERKRVRPDLAGVDGELLE
mmetsp:Transcript_94934/g.168609  ORF Transcript_94934/g.168609 Transcript_94934/m.168609 type:complete len:123 (+) Transcript_94934:910-1278(+)